MPDRKRILQAGEAIAVLPNKSVDQLFIMVLCLLASVPILLGQAPAPGSIDATMPSWMVRSWSATLLIGALVVIIAYLIADRVTSIIVEQFGSVCLGAAATLYGVAIFLLQYDKGGAISAAIILGFAAARFFQVYQYQKVLQKVHVVMAQLEGKPDGG